MVDQHHFEMVDPHHFEREDILGNWYPTDCVVALLGTEDARTAIGVLEQAGLESDKIRHWTSQEMLSQPGSAWPTDLFESHP